MIGVRFVIGGDVRRRGRRAGLTAFAVTVAAFAGVFAPGTAGAASTPALTHSAAQPPAGILDGVWCVSATDCWAVGSRNTLNLILHFNGTAWAQVPAPQQGGAVAKTLFSVTCVKASDCWAVGEVILRDAVIRPSAAHWDGKAWRLVAVPHRGTGNTELFGVACLATANCMAVGAENGRTLAEHWGGSTWAFAPNQGPGALSELQGLSCAAKTGCWTFGSSFSTGGQLRGTVTQRWTGTSFTRATTAVTGSASDLLPAVSCHARQCMAVGGSATAGNLAELWNGSSWTLEQVPSPAGSTPSTTSLDGVSCTSVTCIAVGSYRTASESLLPMSARWNGASWSLLATPVPAHSKLNTMNGAACTSAANCWAVGNSQTSSGRLTPLVEHWNGTAWSLTMP